jgi:LPXTG-motif cell wall-anchored protein
MHSPFTHIDIDTKPFESAVETAFEVVTDTFSDVTESLGSHLTDDVIPMAKAGAQHTQTFVRTRTRVSAATLAGIALLVGVLVVVKRRRRRDDDAEQVAADAQRGPRSVA